MVLVAGTERGLTMTDMKDMALGTLVDYITTYNRRQEQAEREAEREKRRGKRRKATQADINAFFG